MFLEIFLIVCAAAVLDFLVMNIGCKGPWRVPLFRDLLTTIKHFDHFHDFTAELLDRLRVDHYVWQMMFDRVLVITNPDDVKHLLKDNWKNYHIAEGLRGEALSDLLGHGIFHADGHHWLVQRKHASREFSAHIFRTVMTVEFARQARKLSSNLNKVKPNEVVDMHDWFFKLTLDAFGKIAFGLDFCGQDGKPIAFASAFDRAQELSARRIASKPPFLWKLQRALSVGEEKELRTQLEVIDKFVRDLISERQASPELATKEDLLSRLMLACEADKEIEESKRAAYLRDMTVNFIIAGRDTTACAMSWFVYELAKNPDVASKLISELESSGGSLDKDLSFDQLNECHYLHACLSETLRLHPSVPFNPKTAMGTDTFPCGKSVKKGDSVAYSPYAMGRRTDLWGPDARQFKPDRWLDENGNYRREDACKNPVFQAGPRICLGLDMAMLEMKVVMSILVPAFTFKVMEEPMYRIGLVLQMKNGLKVHVQRK